MMKIDGFVSKDTRRLVAAALLERYGWERSKRGVRTYRFKSDKPWCVYLGKDEMRLMVEKKEGSHGYTYARGLALCLQITQGKEPKGKKDYDAWIKPCRDCGTRVEGWGRLYGGKAFCSDCINKRVEQVKAERYA